MSNNLDLVVLKTLVTNKKHALDFVNESDIKLFGPEVFHFASLALGYIRTYKDLPTERVMVEKLGKGANEKQIEHVKKIWNQLETLTDYNELEYKHDLESLKKRFAEQQLTSLKDKLNKLEPGSMDIKRVLNDMSATNQAIKSLHQVKAYDRKTLKEAVPIFREEYNAKLQDPNFDQGTRTGYSYLDNVTDGLRPGELILIGGESGAGKSMLLMNMALQIWLQGNTTDMTGNFVPGNSVLYFSLEMPFKPCLNRVLSRLSGCPSKKIRNATLDQEEAAKLKTALRFINNYENQFEIIDIPRGATMETMELMFEEAKAHFEPKVVVIDYLGLMDYDGPEMDDWLKLGKIAEKIHEFARVHNVIVLSAIQLNRSKGGKDAEEKIGLHRIGRSALIMQNANIGVQIETRPNEKSFPDMYYHLIKNRDGELGKGKLIKNLAAGTLIDDKIEEDSTTFEIKDPDDISEKIELLDI